MIQQLSMYQSHTIDILRHIFLDFINLLIFDVCRNTRKFWTIYNKRLGDPLTEFILTLLLKWNAHHNCTEN